MSSSGNSGGKKRARPRQQDKVTKSEPSTANNEPEVTEAQRTKIREAFDLFHTDKSGLIQSKEVKYAIRSMGLEIKTDEVQTWLAARRPNLRKTGSGKKKCASANGENDEKDNKTAIDIDLFTRIAIFKLQEKERSFAAFRLFDKMDKGVITIEDLKRVASELDEDSMTDEHLNEMVEEADRERDGLISQDNFFRIMKKVNLC